MTILTIQHINTIKTQGGRGGQEIRVQMLTVDGNGNRRAYRVSPEIEDSAYTDLHTSPARPMSLTIEVEGEGKAARVVNYYK